MSLIDPLHCHQCDTPLAFEQLNQQQLVTCGHCASLGAYWVFPAYYLAEVEGQTAPQRTEAEASCFFHPEKLASVVCEGCGRFLCAVCDIRVAGARLCTLCLQSGRTHAKASALENERVLHDSLTLSIAILPILIYPLLVITAPYALYRSIRYFNAPSSIVNRGKWRTVVAMLVSMAEIGGISVIIYFITKALK
jgi:hypothetical protein